MSEKTPFFDESMAPDALLELLLVLGKLRDDIDCAAGLLSGAAPLEAALVYLQDVEREIRSHLTGKKVLRAVKSKTK